MADAVSKLVSLPKDESEIENGETKISSTATTQEGRVTEMENTYAKAQITVRREENFLEWYTQILILGKFISLYDIEGFYILEPSLFSIWEQIKDYFDTKIKSIGVRNCYYPIFISKDNLEREKTHIERVEEECAWVTHGGKDKLERPIGVRQTSEFAMYKDFHDKIRSHLDLPLKRNQWNNVVRWEFAHCSSYSLSGVPLASFTPLRLAPKKLMPEVRQEGHTCFLTREDAYEEVMQILEFYASIYEELLAVPVIKGVKTKNETFPGAEITATIETFVPASGRSIQAATSHLLGQSFAKTYDITVEDPTPKFEGEAPKRLYVWQNSWGFSIRSLGAMMMIHGDDKGAVIPPRVCEIQVALILVGVTATTTPEAKRDLINKIQFIGNELRSISIRVEAEIHDSSSLERKFDELTGIPLRLEFGPKDAVNWVVTTVRRDNGSKGIVKVSELSKEIPSLLDTIQKDMYTRAKDTYLSHRVEVTNWSGMVPQMNKKNVLLIPHCLDGDCADLIKKETSDMCIDADIDPRASSMGAKALCIPFEQRELPATTKCLRPLCGRDAQKWVQFGRSY